MLWDIGELHWRNLVALAYEIKTCENIFCGLFGQIYENLHKYLYPLDCHEVVPEYYIQYGCNYSSNCIVLPGSSHLLILCGPFQQQHFPIVASMYCGG